MTDELKGSEKKPNSPSEVDYNSLHEDGSLRIKIICLGDSAVGKSKYVFFTPSLQNINIK